MIYREPLEHSFLQHASISNQLPPHYQNDVVIYCTSAKVTLRNANVENDDDIRVLVDFKDFLIQKSRNNKKAASDLRETLKYELMEGLSRKYVDDLSLNSLSNADRIKKMLVYDVAGYMIHTRSFIYRDCGDCINSVRDEKENFPEHFQADEYTRSGDRGQLVFVAIPVYETLFIVENVVSKHFATNSHIHVMDSFYDCVTKISLQSVRPLFRQAALVIKDRW